MPFRGLAALLTALSWISCSSPDKINSPNQTTSAAQRPPNEQGTATGKTPQLAAVPAAKAESAEANFAEAENTQANSPDSEAPESSPSPGEGSSLTETINQLLFGKGGNNVIALTADGGFQNLGHITKMRCVDAPQEGEAATSEWWLQIRSAFGRVKVHLRSEAGAPVTGAVIAGGKELQKFVLSRNVAAIAEPLHAGLCKARNAAGSEDVILRGDLLKATESTLTRWVKAIAPACTYTRDRTDWLCRLQTANVSQAKAAIRKIRNRVIRKWSRQPYLLTRRISMAGKLADALGSRAPGPRIRTFCALLGPSLEAELPIALASKTLATKLCEDPGSKVSLGAGRVALRGAVTELRYLFDAVEKDSRLGVLQIRIPASKAPSRNFWVSIQPDRDEKSEKLGPFAPAPCWHPVYSSEPQRMGRAAAVGIAGPGSVLAKGECTAAETNKTEATDKTAAKPTQQEIAEWIMAAIQGETEFIVTNGNAKILRLPRGSYRYVVHALPKNATQWQPSEDDSRSTGSLSWNRKRPAPVIKTW